MNNLLNKRATQNSENTLSAHNVLILFNLNGNDYTYIRSDYIPLSLS